MNMKNLQPQAYMKNNKIHKKSHRRFWGSACLFLSVFLLPVSVTATSAADDESIFVSSDADAPPPDSSTPSPDSSASSPDFDDTASDLDGFFSGDGTNDSARDNTIHVIIENENPSNESNPGDVYTAPDTAGYAGGDSSESPSSGQVILHKPQLLLEDSNLSSQSLQAGSTREMTATFRNKSRSQNVFGLKISLSTETKGIEFGQNSFYVQRLTPGEAITLKSAISIAEDTQPGPVAVTFSLEYEDSKATAATGTEVLTFHILQQLRAELEVADIPLVVYTMDTIEIPVKAMNLGKDKLYNAKVSLEAEGLTPSQTVFLGTIEPGTAADGSMKIYVKGITDENGSLTDQIAGHFLLTYEDSSGNSYQTTSDFLTGLKESQIQSLKVEEEQPQTNSWWYSILAAGGLFLICIILLLLVSLRRKSILLEEARKAASH